MTHHVRARPRAARASNTTTESHDDRIKPKVKGKTGGNGNGEENGEGRKKPLVILAIVVVIFAIGAISSGAS